MSYKVSIVIEKDEYGYYAYSPELEGCQSQGDSLEEAMANIREAIEPYSLFGNIIGGRKKGTPEQGNSDNHNAGASCLSYATNAWRGGSHLIEGRF